jgi:hypothetical protein
MDKQPFNGDSVVVIRETRAAVKLRNVTAGVRYSVYNGDWDSLPDLGALVPALTGTTPDFSGTSGIPGRTGPRYAIRYSGYVQAKVAGYHTFYLNSTHPGRILVDGGFVVGREGSGPRKDMPRRYGCIRLDTGRHAIEVSFLGGSSHDSLSVGWSYPGLIEPIGNLQIPSSALAHGEPVVGAGANAPSRLKSKWLLRGRTLIVPASFASAEIRISDVRGREYGRHHGIPRINLEELPPGTYLVQAWQGGKSSARVRIFNPWH